MNRIFPLEVKVKVIGASLSLRNVAEIAEQHGVSPGAIRFWYNHKVLLNLGDLLDNQPPGPQPKAQQSAVEVAQEASQGPESCQFCGSERFFRNSTYEVINWVLLLIVGWLIAKKSVVIQHFRCAECGEELLSAERQRRPKLAKLGRNRCSV